MNQFSNYYFPGGNTTDGFFSYYHEILQRKKLRYIYTIKGGPGVGKSTLMKEIGKKFEEKGFAINYYHCSSDPDSLDGVLIKEADILFVDGTAPHIIDPAYPGAVDNIINLGSFFDTNKLMLERDDITKISDRVSGCFKIAYNYFGAVKPIYKNLGEMYKKALSDDGFYSLAKSLEREILKDRCGSEFKETRLFLSAITPKGYQNFINETVKSETVYILNSEIGDLSYTLLEKLKSEFEKSRLEIECYYCPIGPEYRLEHIIIPELNIAIVTSNKYHSYNCKGIMVNTSKIYFGELIDQEMINYDLKIIDELLNRGIYYLGRAKSTHDKLEEYYINAMDYTRLNEYTNEIINNLESIKY